MMRRIRLSGNRPNGLIERILVPFRQPRAAAIAVVRLQQLRPVADVEPLAGEAIAVDARPRVEPGDEVAGLIGRIPLGQVGAQQREVLAVVQVRGDRNQVRRGTLGLLLEADDAVVRIELDDAVLTHELPHGMVVDGDRAAVLASPEVDVRREAEVEEVVARDHQELLAFPLLAVGHERDVADGSESILVRGRAVVMDAYTRAPARPAFEVGREARVRDDVNLLDVFDLLDLVEDPVDDRPPPDFEERLRAVVRQWAQPGRVARREDERLHGVRSFTFRASWSPGSTGGT